jgi:molybdate transport system substrate-binding protein
MKIRTSARATALVLGLAMLCALPARAAELTVSAAASLTNAFQDIKPLFEKANPGVTLLTNFAASGTLLKQMSEGAPVDVFASADQETMDQAVAKKLIAEQSRRNFAANSLVMIVPADSTLGLKTPADLRSPKVERIAIGSPDSVPVGRYTEQSLTQAGVLEAVKAKFIPAASVRQVLDYVGRGEVQVGFVYRTDALIAPGKVLIVAEMTGHAPVTYPIAILAASTRKAEAEKFLAFLAGPEGQAVLAKYGFAKP